jgi:hypothetical protein
MTLAASNFPGWLYTLAVRDGIIERRRGQHPLSAQELFDSRRHLIAGVRFGDEPAAFRQLRRILFGLALL